MERCARSSSKQSKRSCQHVRTIAICLRVRITLYKEYKSNDIIFRANIEHMPNFKLAQKGLRFNILTSIEEDMKFVRDSM